MDLARGRPLLLLLVGAVLYYLSYFNYGIDLDDEGFLLVNAQAILHGDWPMADFFSYQPLGYFLLAFFFRIFGEGLLVERANLMILLLVNIGLIYYCARRLMPSGWAVLPAMVYAVAPGPWYKVHFASVLLISLAAMLFYQASPTKRRASLVGVALGIAMATRWEAGSTALVAMLVLMPFTVWWANRDQEVPARRIAMTAAVHLAVALVSDLAVIGTTVLAYFHAGKLESLIDHTLHYYLPKKAYAFVVQNLGRQSVFDPVKLITAPNLELWVWFIALALCALTLFRALSMATSRSRSGVPVPSVASVAVFGLISMAYTFFFVWNSRMLSSFAIVYLNGFFLLRMANFTPAVNFDAGRKKWLFGAAAFAILLYLGEFAKVDFYSGSITARLRHQVTVDHPLLWRIRVHPHQAETIRMLMAATHDARPSDCLIPMSEATTASYLTGLCNPTYYRLFTAERIPRRG